MTANYHTHTVRCHHAVGEDREYVEAAIAEGIKILGFSDHIPFMDKSGNQAHYRVAVEDAADYFASIRSLKKEYEKDIEIHIGFESEYFPQHFDIMLEALREYGPEYLILGQHLVGDTAGHTSTRPTDDKGILKEYVDGVIAGIKTGKFTYVAHPDIINFAGDEDCYLSEMSRILSALKEKDMPVEFNIAGFREKKAYPREDFVDLAAKNKNKYILGIDAHSPEHIKGMACVKEARELLEKKGITVVDTVKLINPYK